MELRRKRATTPQKSSRLQPTESLHMTTRAASKAGSVSSNGGSSRRGSFISNGQVSPFGSNENEGDRYPKRRRISTGSKSTPTRVQNSSQSSSTASRPSTRSMSGNLHPIAESPVPRRKRKRTSDATAENISVAQPSRGFHEDEEVVESLEQKRQPSRRVKRSSTSSNDKANVQDGILERSITEPAVNTAKDLKMVSDDQEITSTNDHAQNASEPASNAAINGADQKHDTDTSMNVSADDKAEAHDQYRPDGPQNGNRSFDSTVAAETVHVERVDHPKNNQEAGEAEDDDDEEEEGEEDDDDDDEEDAEGEFDDEDVDMDNSRDDSTITKELGTTTLDPTPVVSAVASPAGSIPDSSADRDSPTKRTVSLTSRDAAISAGGSEKPTKRLPGRRRAPHPNPKVEAALRRQLHLRMTYRAVAKNLKPLLTELSKRSLNSLHTDSEAHTKASEYTDVKEDLFHHFEKRLAWIQTKKELDRKRLEDILEEQTVMRRRQFEHVARTVQEDFTVRLQLDFLTALRQQQMEQDDDYSDDEGDDVIPSLRRVTRKGGVGSILGPEYHWRSRPAVETERLFNELLERDRVAREHYDHDKGSASTDARPFTTFDPVRREGALVEKKIKDLLDALQEPPQELPREPAVVPPTPAPLPPQPPPTLLNTEAAGLQILALASATAQNVMPPAFEGVSAAILNHSANGPRPEDLSVPRPSLSRTESQATRSHTPAQQEVGLEKRLPTTAPISFSQAVLEPSIKETAPLLPRSSLQTDQHHQVRPSIPGLNLLPSLDQLVSERSRESTLPQVPPVTLAALPAPTPSKPAPVDFWSSLARGSYETDAQGKVKLAPKANTQHGQSNNEPVGDAQESLRQDRSPLPSLPASSTVLEPLSQRLRSTSDSFGPLVDTPGQTDSPKPKKGAAPRKSLYGPWPRSRNYNPLDERRGSGSGSRTQDSLPGLHPRPSGEYTGPYSSAEVRHSAYTPHPPPPQMAGFPTSAPQSGPAYLGAPMYAAAPPPPAPYGYDQRGQPYQPPQLAPYQGPTGFGSLAGAPTSQAPPPQYYGSPHGLPPPHSAATGYPPQALTSRPPPASPAYGPQYGGQPILPAGHDPRYGQNGAAPPASAAPAFAQYQQHDGRRRRNQSLGHREFQHYHGPR